MIDITGVDLVKFAQKVYALSVPQGAGFMHFEPGPLSLEDALRCIRENNTKFARIKPSNIALSMDYVHGRACKMVVRRDEEKLFIHDVWYDHTNLQLAQLLAEFNLALPVVGEHSISCCCQDCELKRSVWKAG